MIRLSGILKIRILRLNSLRRFIVAILGLQGNSSKYYSMFFIVFLGLMISRTAIAHAIREQVAIYQKSLFLVGHPSDGSAIQDDDLRMSFLPTVSTAARPVDQTQSYQPVINYLSDNELERLDKEREKEANRRRKRNTRGRRGIALPDREPLKTQRTPAIGFPEIDPSTLALVAAASAPTSRRAAAAAQRHAYHHRSLAIATQGKPSAYSQPETQRHAVDGHLPQSALQGSKTLGSIVAALYRCRRRTT